MGLITRSGERIAAGEHLGAGGEGRVVAWRDGLCVKLLVPAPEREHVRKLESLIALGPDELRDTTAWPTDLVLDEASGTVAGFVMQRVRGHLVDQIFNAAERRLDHPKMGFRLLVHVARNLAAAIADLHRRELVIGDLNSGGIIVDADQGQVSLIDIDSVQFTYRGERFCCNVGKGEYLPPELHGLNLRARWRDQTSDHFSLAVLIFQLLCMGRHPYIGTFIGEGDLPDPDHAIATTGYAYGQHRLSFGWDRVPGWPHPELIAPALAPLFEAAFAPCDRQVIRPNAAQWVRALDDHAASLVTCRTNPLHAHPIHLSCHWCDFSVMGKEFFAPIERVPTSQSAALSAEEIRQQIEAIRIPVANRLELIRRHANQAQQCPRIVSWNGPMWVITRLFSAIAVISATIAVLVQHPAGPGLIAVAAFVLAVGSWGFRRWLRAWVVDRLEYFRTQASLVGSPPDALGIISGWEATVGELASMPERRHAAVTTLAERHRAAALLRHLSQFRLRGERLSDLGPTRVSALAAHGITTAADIDYSRIRRIRGFGPALAKVLVAWKDRCAAKLSYKPDMPTILLNSQQDESRRIDELFANLQRLAAIMALDADDMLEKRLACAANVRKFENARQELER